MIITAAVAAAITVALATTAAAAPDRRGVPIETKSLDQLYQAALAEGGKLVVYAGGDAPDQLVTTEQAFEKQFPGIQATFVTDFSKFHDARIDDQLDRNRLVPDVAQLQTLQDFDRWKAQKVLLPYKPAGWDQVYPQFKDPDGAFIGINVTSFSNVVNTAAIPAATAPRNAPDYLAPALKDKLVLTYPTDDDAVLFEFKLIIDKYGWGYVDKLLAQNPLFVRGTQAALTTVLSGQKAATFTSFFPPQGAPGVPAAFQLPTTDNFLSWSQTAAIFAKAKHPAAAKLYLNWQLSRPVQDNAFQWSVRKDAVLANGLRPIVTYRNTDPLAFRDFMRNRPAVELLRSRLVQYIGEPQGPPPTGILGPHPRSLLTA